MQESNNTEQSTPQPQKSISKKSMKSFMTLMNYMRPYKLTFSFGLVLLLLSTLTFLFFPFLISMMADLAQGKPFILNALGYTYSFNSRNELAILLIVIILLQSILSFGRIYVFAEVNERVLADIRSDLFSKYITINIPYFEQSRTGDLISRLSTDVNNLQELISINLA